VDDCAVHAILDTHKEIGAYLAPDAVGTAKRNSFVVSRSFNDIRVAGDHVIKSSSGDKIAGEVFFYRNLPPSISKHFGEYVSSETIDIAGRPDVTVLTLKHIKGATLSHLLTSRCLTAKRFEKLLSALREIHSCKSGQSRNNRDDEGFSSPSQSDLQQVNIYHNYASKVKARFATSEKLYAQIESSPGKARVMADELCDRLLEYQKEDRAMFVDVLHGDPVLSNVILQNDGNIRLIDMRGDQGGVLR